MVVVVVVQTDFHVKPTTKLLWVAFGLGCCCLAWLWGYDNICLVFIFPNLQVVPALAYFPILSRWSRCLVAKGPRTPEQQPLNGKFNSDLFRTLNFLNRSNGSKVMAF